MLQRSLLLLLLASLSTASFAQTVTIDGRMRKLQPKPERAYLRQAIRDVRGTSDLPEMVDLTERQTPVKDQGDRGSCAYFTTVALFEHTMKRKNLPEREQNLSEEYLIYANKAIDRYNPNEDGSELRTNIKSMLRHGLLSEDLFPYSHSWFEKGMPCEAFEDKPTAPAYCRSHFAPGIEVLKALVTKEQYQFASKELRSQREVMERLAAGEAVTISLPVNQNGWEGGDTGLVTHSEELEKECEKEPDLCGGHTVLLTGYDQVKKVFFFKNSWGDSWGNKGYGQLSFDYFRDWTYGDFFALDILRLDQEPSTALVEKALSPVTTELYKGQNAKGEEGVLVDLRFDYKAPLGTFFYVSLFAQTRVAKPEGNASEEPSYENVLVKDEKGEEDVLLDRRFILAQKSEDLVYAGNQPLRLFLPKAKLVEAGVWDKADLVLRPTVYGMSDRESYKVLFRTYLSLFPSGTGDQNTVDTTRLPSFP